MRWPAVNSGEFASVPSLCPEHIDHYGMDLEGIYDVILASFWLVSGDNGIMYKGASRSLQIRADKQGRKKKRPLPPEKKPTKSKALIGQTRRRSAARMVAKPKAWAKSLAARHG